MLAGTKGTRDTLVGWRDTGSTQREGKQGEDMGKEQKGNRGKGWKGDREDGYK